MEVLAQVLVEVLVVGVLVVGMLVVGVLEARRPEVARARTTKEVPERCSVHVRLLSRQVSSRCIKDISR
jgi:hypothetical protein